MNYLNSLMPPPPVAQMIGFGDRLFSFPEPLGDAGLLAGLESPGVYVVLAYDATWQPLPYRPLYFGESDRIWSRATASHENYASWKREAGTAALYRAFHHMTGSTRAQRQAVESSLIARYNTPCNERLSFSLEGLLGGRR
jgi:hypothetical protein